MVDAAHKAVLEQQKYVQSVKKFVHLKYGGDRVTSVIIPAGFVLVSAALMVSASLLSFLSH